MRQVDIALSPATFDMHGGFDRYKAKFEALLSAHYTAAVILHDRALTLAQFEPDRYDDPKLRRFAAEKVHVRADASVAGSQAKVDIEMDDGATFSSRCEHPLGSAENPLSRAQIEQKFRNYADGVIADAHIAESLRRWTGWRNSARCASSWICCAPRRRPCDGGRGVIYGGHECGNRLRSFSWPAMIFRSP